MKKHIFKRKTKTEHLLENKIKLSSLVESLFNNFDFIATINHNQKMLLMNNIIYYFQKLLVSVSDIMKIVVKYLFFFQININFTTTILEIVYL
jgi:hypothetical protein